MLDETYIVGNYNPVISAKKADGTQEIGVYDHNIGNRRYITTSSEKVDEFVSERKKKITKSNLIALLTGLGITALGAILGSNKMGDTKKLGALFGATIGMTVSSLTSLFICTNADKKITQDFIEKNK